MKKLALGLLATLVFALALLAWLPASLATSLLLPDTGALRLDDVRGSLWQGAASRVAWQGRELGTLSWQLHPLALLRGRLQADLRLQGDIAATGRVLRGLGGTRLENVQAELPARWLDHVLASPGLHPQGRISLNVAQASFDGERLTALSGELTWRDASVSGAAAAALGDLRAPFALAGDGRVHGTVLDAGGPLSAQGEFVADATHYRADLRLSARDPGIAPALRWLGQPEGGGQRLILQGSR